MANLFDELQWRGLVADATEAVAEALAKEHVTAYIGFDPTASSLHVGSLLTVMGLARLQRFGHAPIAIVGGATGMIGDPSGKSQERVLLSAERIEENVAGVRRQLERYLDFDSRNGGVRAARIVNNADRDVIPHVKQFTFLDRAAIGLLEDVTARSPETREAQRVLAREVTAHVHGADVTARASLASEVLFGENITELSADDVLAVFEDVPSTELPASELGREGIAIVDLVSRVALVPSKSEARRLVQS